MAAGLGTRLRPLTDRVPKCLVPVAGRPLLDYWFDLFGEAGVRDVLINTHHLAEQVRAYVAQRNESGDWRVVESYEPVLLGSGGTVRATRSWADGGGTVLIAYADNLSDVDLRALLAFHASHGDPLTMMLFRAERPERCGIAQLDPAGRIVEFVEKPARPVGNLANAGVYAVTPDAYREMADVGGFDLGFDVLPRFAGRMRGFVWEGYHRDIGDAASLAKAEEAVRSGALRRVAAAAGGVRG
jgi:mannose-1-phosphate guanylyltransferase